jgi:hypothetical protein
MGWRVDLGASFGCAAVACLMCGAASAADFVAPALTGANPSPVIAAPPDYSFWPFQEVRLGVFDHNPVHNESAPVDVSFEILSSPIVFPGYDNPSIASNPWINWFFNPRLNVGAMVNTEGKTSYAFGGANWRIPIWGPIFFEGEFGGAVNNAVRRPTYDRVDMGCPVTFRESGGFGYQFNANFDVIFSVEHISHLSFCSKRNPGITDFGVRVGYKF